MLFRWCGNSADHPKRTIILFLILIAAEALNTGIECISVHMLPRYNICTRDALDLSSFAVFCLLAANSGFFAFAL